MFKAIKDFIKSFYKKSNLSTSLDPVIVPDQILEEKFWEDNKDLMDYLDKRDQFIADLNHMYPISSCHGDETPSCYSNHPQDPPCSEPVKAKKPKAKKAKAKAKKTTKKSKPKAKK